ncbi:hypothetical protein J8I87_05975 [Paraburkholderia sp. LEh10]|uniref:DUF4376 domain-containing protein n=1 Tax=Paraburkholderia sp. LEh10 TaxID=2821353 RepID=UPI001AE411B5|nr:hypothetical protein [Paraburkholderia sp. LEh10]MBP0589271.1 hypothetical protein [Paraburkholderia sp. LEh10]
MARFAIIEGGTVANIVEADADFAQSQGWIDAADAAIGDLWNDSAFSKPTQDLDAAKTTQKAVVSQACQDAIFAGFTSSALGAPHSYPAKFTDQQNLNASVVASLLPGLPADWTTPFWCADADGTWAYLPHTAAQIQQAGRDGKATILACLTKNQQLADQIDAATTIEAVQAIQWSNP